MPDAGVASTVVLASASPRRAELLRRIGLDPVIRPSDVDESVRPGESPASLVARLAREKAAATRRDATDVVVAADTLVVLGAEVLGKPADEAAAERMLRLLGGTTHRVLTGVHVTRGEHHSASVEETVVRFRALSRREMAAYVATGEPFGKAGGYAIQGAGAMFVESITGSYTNVVGLPLATVVRLAAEVGVEILPG